MKMLHRVIGEDYELELDLSEDLTNVYADKGQLEQVIVNLCVNARDAMPGGGLMQIKTGNEILEADHSDIYSWIEPGCFASLSITDNGCGIDSETMTHIFEPFFTTKETGKGTGLGLSTVYGIVRQHEGLIIPESEPGKGTTMKVLLPAAEVGENRDEDIESPPATGGTEIHTNYILDDDVELLQKPFSPSDLLIRIREILDTISN